MPSIKDAALALIVEQFEQDKEMWKDGYNFEVEYDQIDIFIDDDRKLVLVFNDEDISIRRWGLRTYDPHFHCEYANPNFDNLVMTEIRKRLNL